MYFPKREISKQFCYIIHLIHLGWYPFFVYRAGRFSRTFYDVAFLVLTRTSFQMVGISALETSIRGEGCAGGLRRVRKMSFLGGLFR